MNWSIWMWILWYILSGISYMGMLYILIADLYQAPIWWKESYSLFVVRALFFPIDIIAWILFGIFGIVWICFAFCTGRGVTTDKRFVIYCRSFK